MWKPYGARLILEHTVVILSLAACITPGTESPVSRTTPTIELPIVAYTSTAPPPQPSPTTTLFAEKVNTRVPGLILTSTPIFPTLTTVPTGQRLWTKGTPMPTQRSELSSALLNGKIYVAGGTHVEGFTYARVEVYDPKTNSWGTVAPLPIGRHHFGMAELNGKIYVSGGLPDWYRLTETCYVYDPSTDAWSSIASLPYPLATHAMAALNGKLYVVGGNNTPVRGGPMPMFVYDPATDSWEKSPALLPTGREHLAVVAAEGKLYAIGGRYDQDHNLSTLEIFDPETNEWTQGPDLPVASSGLTAAYLYGKIHVTGGEDLLAATVINAHQVLDLTTLTWELWPELPAARHGLTSQAVDGQWIVIGGGPVADISMSARVDIFTP